MSAWGFATSPVSTRSAELHECSGEAGDRVGEAGPERRDQRHRPLRHLPDRIGDEGGRRLALGQHEADALVLAGPDGLQHVVARDADGELPAIGLERGGDLVGNLAGLRSGLVRGHDDPVC
jgi:hypothetical protein